MYSSTRYYKPRPDEYESLHRYDDTRYIFGMIIPKVSYGDLDSKLAELDDKIQDRIKELDDNPELKSYMENLLDISFTTTLDYYDKYWRFNNGNGRTQQEIDLHVGDKIEIQDRLNLKNFYNSPEYAAAVWRIKLGPIGFIVPIILIALMFCGISMEVFLGCVAFVIISMVSLLILQAAYEPTIPDRIRELDEQVIYTPRPNSIYQTGSKKSVKQKTDFSRKDLADIYIATQLFD